VPEHSRRLLLVASAEPTGDPHLLRRAAELLGIEPAAEWTAETTGLIQFGSRVRFRHPLVRSTVYTTATAGERQEAHQALADATDPVADPDRRAWHRANAADGPDEAVAAELERSAERARERGGVAAAAVFLERAARLTPDPGLRSARELAAAHAKFEAADPQAAYELLAATRLGPLDGAQRALLLRLQGQIVFVQRRGSDAPALLLEAARALESHDVDLARETYLDALGAASFAGPYGEVALREVALAAREAPAGIPPARPIDLLLDALSTLITDGYAEGVPRLRDALSAFRSEPLESRDEIIRWLGLACPLAEEAAVHQLWDFEAWQELSTRAVQLARDTGALAFLPVALVYSAGAHLHRGDFDAASAMIDEADEIAGATGLAPVSYATLVLAAWRGDASAAIDVVTSTLADAGERGEGIIPAVAGFATALLHNGLGNYDAAHEAAAAACAADGLIFSGWALVELIEATARRGTTDEAWVALDRLEERALASGTDWALGVLARSRALLAEPVDAEALYREAIQRSLRSGVAIDVARGRLLYGEWLRRENRRTDARRELRTAHDMFVVFGAGAFAERSRRELLATGETVRKRITSDRAPKLTAQEAQVAALTVEGLTNSEIGSKLFISPRTVEYHLGKVFTKLGIRSRRDLKRAMTALAGGDSRR
jgi:DNA-binding CsgD family transcriptional regulator